MPLLSPSLPSEMDILTRYDAKLDEVNKGYLALFQERLRVEEQYADGLAKLYAKSRAFDSWYDDSLPHPLPSSRLAWREIRELTEREAEARKAFVAALDEAVIGHLADVRDTQTRIRARIKSDLKLANEMYAEQAEHKVPKLKRQYFKKCAEVEEQRKQEAAIALQAKLLSDPIRAAQRQAGESPPTGSSRELPPPGEYHYFAAGTGGAPPTVSDPLPPSANPAAMMLDHETAGSSSASGGRKRSGSTNQQEKAKEVLNDLALQGKRQINAFISRFGGGGANERERDDGDSSSGGATSPGAGAGAAAAAAPTHARYLSSDGGRPAAGHSREGSNVKPSALKGVKLKREAEEAGEAPLPECSLGRRPRLID